MLEEYAEFFQHIESSLLNPAQARAVVNGEQSLLRLQGAEAAKHPYWSPVGWLLARGEAAAEQIPLLAFGRKAAEEMDDRIRERLQTQDVTARTFHSLALYIISQGSKSSNSEQAGK